jgi:hypothetical protein
MKRTALLALLLGASWVVAAPAPLPKADSRAEKEKVRVVLGEPTRILEGIEFGPPALMPLPRPIPAGLENADPPVND